jgi:photoactive yellow protein
MANQNPPWQPSKSAAFNAKNNKIPMGITRGKGRAMATTIDFDAPDLASDIEQLSQYDLDNLPFGVILIDGAGTILFYSETERRETGLDNAPLGKNLFEISPCFGADEFRGRIKQAEEAGPVDLEIGWPGDYADPQRELRIRVQSARRGGLWLFIERDAASGGAASSIRAARG